VTEYLIIYSILRILGTRPSQRYCQRIWGEGETKDSVIVGSWGGYEQSPMRFLASKMTKMIKLVRWEWEYKLTAKTITTWNSGRIYEQGLDRDFWYLCVNSLKSWEPVDLPVGDQKATGLSDYYLRRNQQWNHGATISFDFQQAECGKVLFGTPASRRS
jgi:hypothetical protein